MSEKRIFRAVVSVKGLPFLADISFVSVYP